jgi:hypothetical protein
MANVVFGGAYATEVIAAQRVFYNQRWGFTYQILLGTRPRLDLLASKRHYIFGTYWAISMQFSPINAIIWVFVWWASKTVSCLAVGYDMATDPRQLRPLQHSTLFLLHISRSEDAPRAILWLLLNGVISMVLGTWLSLHSSQYLQLCLLDCSQECCRKPGMRICRRQRVGGDLIGPPA